MKVTYDPRHNVAYIRLREQATEVETLRISDELNIDLAPEGTVYGIELLNANAQLALGVDEKLVFVNEESGQVRELDLSRCAGRDESANPPS